MAKQTISASLALEALSDAQRAVIDAEHVLTQRRIERDELIRDARAAKIPYTTLMARTRLGKQRLIAIAKTPRPDEYTT